MKQYRIVLTFNNGMEIPSILLDKEPTEKEIKEGIELYKADNYRIETIDN